MYLNIDKDQSSNRDEVSEFTVPSSKPETQRALLISSLASGTSKIFNYLTCVETDSMIAACRSIGAVISITDEYIEVTGISGKLNYKKNVIDCKGSGLVFRTFTALSSISSTPVLITGDKTLRKRVMAPLFKSLKELGANIECIVDDGKAPVVNWGNSLVGGETTLPADISSQFITAILLAAPFAEKPIELTITGGKIFSLPYVNQTLISMRKAGIHIEVNDDKTYFRIEPGQYLASDYYIGADYTSSSYLFAYALTTNRRAKTLLKNIQEKSDQGEKAIVDIARALGAKINFNDEKREAEISVPDAALIGDFSFDANEYPNIVPTLATLGSFVEGSFKVTGGSITRLHKAPRIHAMVTELTKMGVNITELFDENNYSDGFHIINKQPADLNGALLTSWGDHRIFMSLFLAAMSANTSSLIDGYQDVNCSFPDFLLQFERNNLQFHEQLESFPVRLIS